MRVLLVAVVLVHGLIHFLGVAKAFGWAELAELSEPIPPAAGVMWLVAGLGMWITAWLLLRGHGAWWVAGLASAVVSQAVVVGSWSDAWAGTIPNVALAAGALYGLAAGGPWSFTAQYRRQVAARVSDAGRSAVVTEADLAHLPDPLARYVRASGAVGQPRVRHFRAVWKGRIRAAPDDAWMPFTAEQHNFLDGPARFFLMKAVKGGLPVDVFHAFVAGRATMKVRLLSLVPVVDASGPELDRAETVTVFNDLCLLAPWALVDPGIGWEERDDRTVQGVFTVGEHTVRAVLRFNERDELVDFVSDDRRAASPDGTSFEPLRWSTPVSDYRRFGPLRVMTRGQGLWHPDEGAFVYFEAELVDVVINPEGGGSGLTSATQAPAPSA